MADPSYYVSRGGGDVTLELAGRVGPRGRDLGVDIDRTKINVTFDELDLRSAPFSQPFTLLSIVPRGQRMSSIQ